jgi:hypothetical protein
LPDFIENCLTCQIHDSAANTVRTQFEHILIFAARVKYIKELVSPNYLHLYKKHEYVDEIKRPLLISGGSTF